jgi:hypothetical protein
MWYSPTFVTIYWSESNSWIYYIGLNKVLLVLDQRTSAHREDWTHGNGQHFTLLPSLIQTSMNIQILPASWSSLCQKIVQSTQRKKRTAGIGIFTWIIIKCDIPQHLSPLLTLTQILIWDELWPYMILQFLSFLSDTIRSFWNM